ncbi:MAG: hypothetical protein AB7O97_08520 [Planctomycetota bacterium]
MAERSAAAVRGLTIPELLLGLMIMATVAAVMINHLTINLQSTVSERDRLYAYGKAQAILAEIQSHVDDGDLRTNDTVDALDDGIVNKFALTTATDVDGNLVLPDHVLSGNWRRAGEWVWSRRISVQPFPGVDNRNVRYVTVKVYQRDLDGVEREAASLSAVVNAPGQAFPTTQVFDLYLLAVENIPGWWVFMDSIRPFVESTITDLETRNPGLEVRTHWITKAAFGRNPVYRPYINDRDDSLAPIPDVYFYPGRMPAGSASVHYYVPGNIHGHVSRDGEDLNGWDPLTNPHPYALCDYFNHAMRHPEEKALWEARVAAVTQRELEIRDARIAGIAPPPPLDDMSKEPTLRLFFDDLYTNPEKYRNALVINLHGELLPMPAVRNYSDAARDPIAAPEVRVVTHAEQIRTVRDPGNDPAATEPARFRVYAYSSNVASGSQTVGQIELRVLGVDLTDGTTGAPDLLPDVRLSNLRGGVPVGILGTGYDVLRPAKVAGSPLEPGEMFYTAVFLPDAGDGVPATQIMLFNTPCVAPLVGTQGLATGARLYGMDYVPSPCSPYRDFRQDLSTPGSGPKNTARWVLEVPSTAFRDELFIDPLTGRGHEPADDVVLAVQTRIWTGPGAKFAGVMWPPTDRNAPENLSTTYTWWCDSADDVPVTERSQFFGDPRHCPYSDLMRESASGDPDHPAPAPDFANGYNWFFDSLAHTSGVARPGNGRAGYNGLSAGRLTDLWRGAVSCDVPRMMEMLRKGLVASRCVYTTLTGFSYYYLGVGGDIGYDSANGYPNSIPVDLTPYGAPGSSGYVNNITGARTLVRQGTGGNGYWWSMPWLGDLYPDAMAAQWYATDSSGNPRGNLTAGTGNSAFRHVRAQSVHGGSIRAGLGVLMPDALQRLKEEGCTSFFNTGTASSTFHHRFADGTTGSLTTSGDEIAQNYNFNMPDAAPISRPFSLAASGDGTVGTEWNFTPYSAQRFNTSLLRSYYDHPTRNIGSGLVQLTDPVGRDSAFVVVNGIDRTVESGSNFIAKFSVLTLVHSFFEAGGSGVAGRIQQPVRAEIVQPTDVTELIDPSDIEIVVEVSWRRWDGRPYTNSGSVTENETELEYVVTYSADGGVTWRYMRGNGVATPGERPANSALLVSDTGPGPERFTWTVPDDAFPQGSYYLRVDCFRRGAPIHFSYHMTKLFIQR